jgi:hypothetical protein
MAFRSTALIVLVGACAGVVALLSATSAAGSGSPTSQTSSRPVWSAYATSVDPGSRVGLASARTGLALSWQPTPGLDDNLASPAGLDLAWPSPSILVTHDGARSWSRSLTIPGGFWGLDTLNAADAWAIGVARLYRTIDAGRTWQRLHEAREPLVRVAFRTPTRGFGLTVSGRLVETNDSGRSWQAGRLQTRGVALCGPDRRDLAYQRRRAFMAAGSSPAATSPRLLSVVDRPLLSRRQRFRDIKGFLHGARSRMRHPSRHRSPKRQQRCRDLGSRLDTEGRGSQRRRCPRQSLVRAGCPA